MSESTLDSTRTNITECRTCQSKNLHLYLPLGDQALANSFLTKEQLEDVEATYPLEVFYCGDCFHSQLGYTVDPDEMFRNYLWVSGTSDEIPVHFEKYADEVYERFMKDGDLVVEAASNDGTLLKAFKKYDVRILGVDPARNIAEIAEKENGVPTMAEYFNVENAKKIVEEHGHAAAVIANNVFAHVDDLGGFTDAAYTILKDDGIFTIESPHALDFLKKNEFDTVYHEHISYLSLTALAPFFERHKMRLFDVQQTAVHGGSIRMYVSKDMSKPISESLKDLLQQEEDAGVSDPATYEQFGKNIAELKTEIVDMLTKLKKEGKTIAGYGASAKGQTLLQYCGIGTDILEYVADKAPLKQGRYTPGTHIPIVHTDAIKKNPTDYLFILAWNFADEIMSQQADYAGGGGQFIVPVPHPRIIS